MPKKITIPLIGETQMEDFIPKLKEFGEAASMIKKHYPSVWNAIEYQYGLDIGFRNKKISDGLFERKLEVFILQDEELRNR